MAFHYAHHRPLTPITPIHSPHPSAGSSVRTRTPGQLSLHEYRKMQVTPSPPAVPGQKTVKKKRGLSSLSRTESLPARPPDASFFSSFQSLTTPPETPSLAPPIGCTSTVSPVEATTVLNTELAPVGSTYSEFAHLLSFGSELQHSPPYSPPLPSLSSTSRPLLSISPYQPSTPIHIADFAISAPQSSKPQLLDWGRTCTKVLGQDQRYVKLHRETGPRSEATDRAASRASSERPAMREFPGHFRRLSGHDTSEQQSLLEPPFPGTLIQDPLLGARGQQSRTPQDDSHRQLFTIPQVATEAHAQAFGILNTSKIPLNAAQPRECHFNPIKRLPRPLPSTKKRPTPLQLNPHYSEGVYQSGDHTASTSTYSLSKYPFPQPPQTFVPITGQLRHSLPANIGALHDAQLLSTKSPSLRFSGASFEIVNPHSSLESAQFDTLSESDEFPTTLDHLYQSDSENDDMGSEDGSRRPPKGKRFSSPHRAWRVIRYRSRSRTRSRASSASKNEIASARRSTSAGAGANTSTHSGPSTSARASSAAPEALMPPTPSWVRFDEHGQRVDENGLPVTSAIEAGPPASQTNLSSPSLTSSLLAPSIQGTIENPEPVYTSNVPILTRSRLTTFEDRLFAVSAAPPLQLPERAAFSAHTSSQSRPSTYGSNYESLSIVGGHGSLPAGLAAGDTRYSLAATGNDGYDDDAEFANRISDPFPYRDYESRNTDQDSTLVDFINQYAEIEEAERVLAQHPSDTNESAHESSGAPQAQPIAPRIIKESSPTSSQQAPVTNGLGLADVHNTSGSLHITNGSQHSTNSYGTPHVQGYPRVRGMHIRDVPVAALDTLLDFQDAVDDMRHRPLSDQDSDFLDRYYTLMKRIGREFGREARASAEDELHDVVPAPRRRGVTNGFAGAGTEEEEPLAVPFTGLRDVRRIVRTPADLPASLTMSHTGTSITLRQPPVYNPSNFEHWFDRSDNAALRELRRPIPGSSDWTNEDDSSVEQQQAQEPHSPLDNSPPPTSYSFPGTALSAHPDLADAVAPPQLAYGQSGPPPREPVPPLPNDDQQVGIAMVPPPLFADPNPFEQSEVSSYDNTGRLLGIPSAIEPLFPSVRKITTIASDSKAAVNANSYTFGPPIPISEEQGIPRMWSHSPTGSSRRKQQGSNDSNNYTLQSQTTNNAAATMEEKDEWETVISRSNHNSATAEYHNFHQLPNYPLPAEGILMPPPRLYRPNNPHLPGFYPTDELSSEPHDDYERTPVPREASTRFGHYTDDIELGALSTISRRSRNSQRSRFTRASVRRQTSLQPLVLKSPSTIWPAPPVIYEQYEGLPRSGKLWRDVIIWSCITWGAIIPIGSLLLGSGCLDEMLGKRLSRRMKLFARAEFFVAFFIIIVVATVGITIHVRAEKKYGA